MNKLLINQLHFFSKVVIPKYIELKIQKIALKHLELPDMGKLKDRMEGQLYYDNLKVDLLAEYAFEKTIGIKYFNWTKRENKFYKRKQYFYNGKILYIETFKGLSLPKLKNISVNIIFAYVNPDNRVYISGLATINELKNLKAKHEENYLEFSKFDTLKKFKNIEDLIYLIE